MEYRNNKCFLLAEENFKLARWLFNERKAHYDWVVTVLYYSALMYSRALFELWYLDIPDTHRTKYDKNGNIIKLGWNQAIGDKLGKDVRYDYDNLYRASRKFRYDPVEAIDLDRKTTFGYIIFYKRLKENIIEGLNSS